jgi:hypothetical protein
VVDLREISIMIRCAIALIMVTREESRHGSRRQRMSWLGEGSIVAKLAGNGRVNH